MVKTFTDKFRLSANMTLANFKFRGLTQNENENFDLFCIRIKNEAKGCNFKCTNDNCTIPDIMVRDQIPIMMPFAKKPSPMNGNCKM